MSVKKSQENEAFINCISKETRVIWTGDYVVSEFRQKIDALVLKESESSQLKKDGGCNLRRINQVWGCASIIKLVEECKKFMNLVVFL